MDFKGKSTGKRQKKQLFWQTTAKADDYILKIDQRMAQFRNNSIRILPGGIRIEIPCTKIQTE